MDGPELYGGGLKKVLYTLDKVRSIGFRKAGKALSANNTCKACGLGMGGQLGGMVNEMGEFPAVCNKSVQAQSTDIQPEIPEEIFAHDLESLKELSEKELASLGRLNAPLVKERGQNCFRPVSWDLALERIAGHFEGTDASRSFFYSSGRSSNEAGFLLQLFARLYGTNNISNCSFYCHQATGVALEATVGTGTSTVELSDLAQTDLFFLLGANPASNHPRLIHQLEAVRKRGGHVVVINPAREPGLVRFAVPKSPASLIAGGTEIASCYLQPRIGSDRVLMQGIAKAVLEQGAQDEAFVSAHTDGYAAYRNILLGLDWSFVEAETGLSRGEIQSAARLYGGSDKAVFAWGMGLTHHLHGVENIEEVANLALLRGMVGKLGAGLLPLRGHSNVQGIGTIGVKPVLASEVLERIEAEFAVSLPRNAGLDTMASLERAAEGDMDLALIMGGNLYAATPNSMWAQAALDRIRTKVYLTTTLNRGHLFGSETGEVIVLPVTARDEEWQPTSQESMFSFVRLSDGGINRLDNVRPETWILAALADRVLGRSPVDFRQFQKHRRVREAIARTVPGLEALADLDVARKEFHIRRRLLHEPVFNTASGKARFVSKKVTAWKQSRPFTLMSVRTEGQFNSIVYEDEDIYRGVSHRWTVLMNRNDMARLALSEGTQVDIKSAHGVMTCVEVRPFDLPAGDCMAYYPEANALTGTAVDPRSRTPAFKSVPVSITRSETNA